MQNTYVFETTVQSIKSKCKLFSKDSVTIIHLEHNRVTSKLSTNELEYLDVACSIG